MPQQQDAFRRQIKLAKQYKLPIVIHCREAFDEIFEILEEEKSADLFGIFHCFSGTYEQALQAISYNMKLGIGGVVTFKNGKIDQFLNQIDLEAYCFGDGCTVFGSRSLPRKKKRKQLYC